MLLLKIYLLYIEPIIPLGVTNDMLTVEESRLRGTGHGLFYNGELDINEDMHVCEYGGELCEYHESFRNSDYVIKLFDDVYRNAKEETEELGKYIQDCIIMESVNCKMVVDPLDDTVGIYSTRRISVGEELYLSYGSAYWYDIRLFKKLSMLHRGILYERATRGTREWIIENDLLRK
jgi:hypothetical protein